MRRAIFLDRDGVLIEDKGYVHRVGDIEILPGIQHALADLKLCDWLLVVVTNQSGIGRELFTEDDYELVAAHLKAELPQVDAWIHCPHSPTFGCECRKPKPGMLLAAAKQFDIDLSRSITVGDKLSDVEAGHAAGCWMSILVRPGQAADILGMFGSR